MASVLGALLCFGATAMWLYAPAARAPWSALEKHYRFAATGAPVYEDAFPCVSCTLGNHRFALSIEIHQTGLYLRTAWPWMGNMPTVLIPWDKIRLVYVTEGGWLVGRHVELAVEHYPLRFIIPGLAGRETARWIKQVQGLTGPGPNYFFPGHKSAQEAQ